MDLVYLNIDEKIQIDLPLRAEVCGLSNLTLSFSLEMAMFVGVSLIDGLEGSGAWA